jgi:hypothetical protein
MMPQQIGFAAAYEAYRRIKYGFNVYNLLYTDYWRQYEALRALAIAEGMSLSILPLSHVLRGFLALPKLRACGKTRVVESTNMAYGWRVMLQRQLPVTYRLRRWISTSLGVTTTVTVAATATATVTVITIADTVINLH